jgi:hypothetical protein
MKDLAKLDLEPDEVYNVSLSVSQGTKKFDNLRFFQTKVPKLFNLIPSQYTTFSRVATTLEPIIPDIRGGDYEEPPLIQRNISTLRWEIVWSYDRSEGETSINLGGSNVDIRLTFDNPIPTFAYEISGFPAEFACLNGRTDWKRVAGRDNKVFELTIPVTEFDPGIKITSTYVINRNVIGLRAATAKGGKTFFLSDPPNGAVPGSTVIQVRSPGMVQTSRTALPANTKISGINLSSKTITAATKSHTKALDTWSAHYETYQWVKGIQWGVTVLNPGSDRIKSITGNQSPLNGNATGKYYGAPKYNPITSTYDFKGSSTVNTELLNATVLDAIIWEDEVRDFVYFFISDTFDQPSPTWYYFSTTGGINAATSGFRISPTPGSLGALSISPGAATGDDRVLNGPPPRPAYVSDVDQYPSYPPSELRARARFYSVNREDISSTVPTPPITYSIAIRFAIARYTKVGSDWNGVWLGSDNLIKNVLSLPELAEA